MHWRPRDSRNLAHAFSCISVCIWAVLRSPSRSRADLPIARELVSFFLGRELQYPLLSSLARPSPSSTQDRFTDSSRAFRRYSSVRAAWRGVAWLAWPPFFALPLPRVVVRPLFGSEAALQTVLHSPFGLPPSLTTGRHGGINSRTACEEVTHSLSLSRPIAAPIAIDADLR